jgi:serine/arginine repetitive matrix protein 2
MSPSAQIGRLIENLSQGLDAGTFNFSMVQSGPSGPLYGMNQGHSASSSMSENWTVEQRLDHMLGSMRGA